ncbi:DISARM system SNF2-like helicase DrmD [Streptomyces sp. NRRL F-5126]|uniref:DISARM system SNF2-like helicase DrmD n=1 Tax=Streptomyces sp. NRRL F-5126 TaxID=1463857 RepID=UPI00099DD929|nr:DISARM system SNF2-like helicase DrmD [Streptomyces sp. NRRL F-5126]
MTTPTTDLAGVAQRAVRRRAGAQDHTGLPEISDLVEVRGQRWVVADIDHGNASPAVSAAGTLVTLNSVEDGRYNDTLSVIWEIEPGRRRLPAGSLPEVAADRFDPPERLAAFLDAVRWSAVTSADARTLQAPFRSGVAVEPYQLEPVSRAVAAPRVNLLLADDVGLGKTVEAGLVALELILRNRAHKIMVVCPAGLTVKWRDEMAEKFGLDFTIVDSACAAEVRRTHGSAANPFNIHPRCIVSLPWLRGAKAQRLLAEVLPAQDAEAVIPGKRAFDLLILDEAHHVAPSAPKQLYPVDSQQTKLIRRLAPHFEHRLFLSATPHNGYQQSYTALLEIVDNQRFARGVDPDPKAVEDTVVRRLKSDIRDPVTGERRFLERRTQALPVEYTRDERRIHALLKEYAQLRRAKLGTRFKGGRKAADLVTLLLKKRLFSSPDAFARTIEVYLETLRTKKQQAAEDVEAWQETFFDDYADYDDEPLAEAEDDAIARATTLQPGTDGDESALLEQMRDWARRHQAQADSKARELITYLKANCIPDGSHWQHERVVVFTEYRDTQVWLQNLLRDHGLGGDRVALLHGGLNTAEREELRLAFQAEPAENPVRILLATDAASEGIDLQRHCHRLVNYDIPFNPNKLEQRIGRIDRYGQRKTPEVVHFVGSNYEESGDTYEADLEFLARVAVKVARMEEDLGKVNAVLADAVQRRMTGDLGTDFDVDRAELYAGRQARRGGNVPSEREAQAQAQRLSEQVAATVSTLGITPDRIARVVSTALPLARQQDIHPVLDDREAAEGFYEVPTLTGSWERAGHGLADKLRPEIRRPVTFDPAGVRDRDDVVLAHLGHPLVAMSTRLLRAAVWNKDQAGLARVSAVVSDHPELETTLVGAFARFVLVGADGVRLHEEVLQAGGWLRDADTGGQSRFSRLEKVTTVRNILDDAFADHATPAAPLLRGRLAESWPHVGEGLVSALEWRARNRQTALEGRLETRRREDAERITAQIDRFRQSLRRAIGKPPGEEGQLELAFDEAEQQRRDRDNWEKRADALESEKERELAAIAARYARPKALLFPVAVVFVVPRREAVK